jgi:hypothetical protein
MGHTLRKDPQAIERDRFSIGTLRDGVRKEDLGGRENCRRRDWKSGKDLERSWSLGTKKDPLRILPGSPMFLKE